MTREELVEIGVSAEVADKVVEKFGKMIPKSRFDEINDRMKKAEADVKERDAQIDGLKKATGDSDSMKQKIIELQKANKEASDKYAADLKQKTRDNSVALAFTAKKSRNISASRALVKFDETDFDDDGSLNKRGLAKIEEDVKANGWAYDIEDVKGGGSVQLKGVTPAKPIDGSGNGGNSANLGAEAASSFMAGFQAAK